jgi:3-oxoacyl-[acyl-carrier protein] reductase
MAETERWLAGRVALVTGGVGRGIGRSIALHLARAGADVALSYGSSGRAIDRGPDAERIIQAITEFGARAIALEADTRTDEGVASLIRRSNEAFGRVDILVNNAGAPWLEQDFAEITAQRWRDTLAAEVVGPAALTAALLPAMREQGWGRVVNIVLDFRAFEFLLDANYGHRLRAAAYPFWIGKRARMEMTEQLAHAELRHGVTINSVLPGVIEECGWETALAAASRSVPPEPGPAGPPDVARIVVRLCSDEFSRVTGSRLVVPGNLHSIR